MKSPSDSAASTPSAANGNQNPLEREFDRIIALKSTSPSARALLQHMKACLGGKIPECATCLDATNVPCQSGWCRCPDCG